MKHGLSFLILLIAAALGYGTSNSDGGSYQSPSVDYSPKVSIEVADEHLARPSDVKDAKELLAGLPATACARSSASAAQDGTVTVHLRCSNDYKSMNGIVRIKNGLVTDIQ